MHCYGKLCEDSYKAEKRAAAVDLESLPLNV